MNKRKKNKLPTLARVLTDNGQTIHIGDRCLSRHNHSEWRVEQFTPSVVNLYEGLSETLALKALLGEYIKDFNGV